VRHRRRGHACFECGRAGDIPHHVVPFSLGGTRTVTLCGKHHELAHGGDGKASDNSTLVRRALKKLRDSGITFGRIPYGYEVRKDKRGIKKGQEYRWLVGMLERRLSGWTCKQIATWLRESKAPHKYGITWSRHNVDKLVKLWL
jgi:hypothetical protein